MSSRKLPRCIGPDGLMGDDPGSLGYTAAKHGVVGLMRAYANHLAPHRIRVNSIHPAAVGLGDDLVGETGDPVELDLLLDDVVSHDCPSAPSAFG